MATIPGYYTLDEAARVLKKAHSTVARYVRDGLIPAIDLGNVKLIEQSAVHNFSPNPRGNPNFRKHGKKS